MAEFGISEHYAIFCNRKVNFRFKKNSHKSIKYRSFKHFDENAFLTDLFAALLNQIETFETADDALEAWNSIFLKVVDNHAPVRCHSCVVVQELEFAINRDLYVFFWSLGNQYIVGSLSWRSLTHTENFRAKWLQWPFTTEFSSSEVSL